MERDQSRPGFIGTIRPAEKLAAMPAAGPIAVVGPLLPSPGGDSPRARPGVMLKNATDRDWRYARQSDYPITDDPDPDVLKGST